MTDLRLAHTAMRGRAPDAGGQDLPSPRPERTPHSSAEVARQSTQRRPPGAEAIGETTLAPPLFCRTACRSLLEGTYRLGAVFSNPARAVFADGPAGTDLIEFDALPLGFLNRRDLAMDSLASLS